MNLLKTALLVTFCILLFVTKSMAQSKIIFSSKSVDLGASFSKPQIINSKAPQGFYMNCTNKTEMRLYQLNYEVKYLSSKGSILKDSSFIWENVVPSTASELDKSNAYKVVCNYWPKKCQKAIVFVTKIAFGDSSGGTNYYAPGY